MKLPYFLTKLYLTGSENKYRAQVQKQEVLSREELAKRMANKNTAFSTADISGVFNLMQTCIIEAIEEGYAVDGIMGMLKYSIQGSFENIEDSFDHSRHGVKANITLYRNYIDAINKIQVEKVTATVTGPNISLVKDGTDHEAEVDTLKTGGIAKIIGENLKVIAGESSNGQGIFFINNSGVETKADLIIDNNPSRLTIVIPNSLVAGNYNLQVRTYYNKSQVSKQLLKGIYDNNIQLVAP
ncbi:HU family DNA-binding protein [Labilibacter marinus]|uniref:HU family DNA-binding protein n=1 Tax=Labilibacter marinus TaxID=1477105 RepID=UPI00082A335E|nr:DNA-binding domain-containing protein [Labilibacter marinus]